ncbi:MAG: hypothetical protein LBH01_07295, partial [Verrucomicrobiales bacterium]|nr:hypothetical protein [Verrucomicrobiales bacterium]
MSLIVRELFSLDHERQILTIDYPTGASDYFTFHDANSSGKLPAQRSRQNPNRAFLQIQIKAGQQFQLNANNQGADIKTGLAISGSIITNGNWSAEIFLGEWIAPDSPTPTYDTPTPVKRLQVGNGTWRGNNFFDTRQPVRQVTARLLESGPLRIMVEFKALIGKSGSYQAQLTFDAGADFIRIDESFDAGANDQLVWDFSGADLPEQIHLLDSSAGFNTLPLAYYFDRRLARLACWNQYSQLHDFSDGYALSFANGEDAIGFVALNGGTWTGNSHNFLEAWMRRWLPNDAESRRIPAESKADAAPSPESIAARPVNRFEPHFSVEGWLHHGSRSFALTLTTKSALPPADWNKTPPLGHFEIVPDRPRYRQQQSLLRRIHTQHGLLPLASLVEPYHFSPLTFHSSSLPPWENPDNKHEATDLSLSLSQRIERILSFLAARVYGFWEGSGSAYTNAVVSRRLAHELLDWEWLAANGHLSPEQLRQGNAWFIFLAKLFSSANFYPGKIAMNLGDTHEPTMAHMANQNFFTDTFNFPGMAAQVFHTHPDAPAWREYFGKMWRRQLEYHMYPDSGVWEESHTYFHHVLHTILPTLERRHKDGVDNWFADAAFQKLVSSALKTLTPRDHYFGNKRHTVALGDHNVDPKDYYRPLYLRLSRLLAIPNPELAAQFAWAYHEMDGTESLPLAPKAPAWKNEYVQGLGYFFRATDRSGKESLMVLRCGNSWGHHHNDEGSLQFFAAGRSWIVDSAFSNVQRDGIRKFRADGHSRWAPRDFAPLNYLWQFNRGWIQQHDGDAPFPYAVAFTPVYMAETNVQQYIPLRRP